MKRSVGSEGSAAIVDSADEHEPVSGGYLSPPVEHDLANCGRSRPPEVGYPTEICATRFLLGSLALVFGPWLYWVLHMDGTASGLPRWAAIVMGNWISLLIVWLFAAALLALIWKRLLLGREARATEEISSRLLPELLARPSRGGSSDPTEWLGCETATLGGQPRTDNLLRALLVRALIRRSGRSVQGPPVGAADFDDLRRSMIATYLLPTFAIFAIPVVGFIGTVWGISGAVAGFSATFQQVNDASNIAGTLQQAVPLVTAKLATAFDTTLLALLLSLPMMLLHSGLQKREERYLLDLATLWRTRVAPGLPGRREGSGQPVSTPRPAPDPVASLVAEVGLLSTQIRALRAVVTDFGEELVVANERDPAGGSGEAS